MKTKHIYPIILVMSGLVLNGCNSGNSNGQSSSVTAPQTVKPGAVSNHSLKHVANQEGYIIGKGYSKYLGSISELTCYNAGAHQGEVTGSLGLRASYGATSFEKYTRDLLKVTDNSGGANPFIKLDGLLEYAREQKSDDFSTSMYITSISNRTVEVTPVKKADDASDEYASLWSSQGREQLKYLQEGLISPEQFSKVCGDHTIKSYGEYAAFVIKLTYKFKNKEDNMKFRDEIYGKYTTLDVKQAHEVEQKMQQFGGELFVEGRQWGGVPTQLPQATSSLSGVTTCDPKNTYACDQLMSALLQYGSTFSNQFSANNPNSNNEQEINMQLTGKFVIGPSFYELSGGQGIGESYSIISPEIIKSREQLMRDLELVNNANRIFDDLMTNHQAKLSMQGIRPNPDYNLGLAVLNPRLEKNTKMLNDDQLSYLTLYYNKLKKLYKQFNSDGVQSKGENYNAIDCWTVPESCQKVATVFHNLVKNTQVYIVNLKTTSHVADSFKRELAIIDLDDDPEYGSNLHYIRLFNLTHGPQYGIYIGKIPYLEQSSDIFDNVGYSLAAGYPSESSSIYNNGYFFAGIKDIELNKLTPDEYSKDFLVDGCSYTPDKRESFYKVGKFEDNIYTYCKDHGFGGDGGNGSVATECYNAYEAYQKEYFSKGLLQCIPYDFRQRTDKNLLGYYNSRLIISKNNNPLKYSGRKDGNADVGQIKSHSGYEARLSNLSFSAFHELNSMLDPAALATIFVSHLLRDDGKIYYTDKLYYLHPYDSIALKEFDCNKLDSVEKAACLVSQATANNSKGTPTLRFAYSQYAAYHQGVELPGFMLEYSLLGEKGDYDEDYTNEKTNEFGY